MGISAHLDADAESAADVALLLIGNDRAVHLLHATTALEAVVLLQQLEEVGSRELARAAIAVDGEIVHERVRDADGFRDADDDRTT
ncbi:MAG: hypothetical protein QM820_17560 [Minicystis sp.]